MNTGLISSRYAEALLRLVNETGGGERVLSQVQAFEKAFAEVPQFRSAMEDGGALTAGKKIEMFELSLGGEALAPELRSLISLMVRAGRSRMFRLVFTTFQKLWYSSNKIKTCNLTIAAPSSALEERMKTYVRQKTGCEPLLRVKVDPDIVGGFIFEVDDRRIDASVKTRLKQIRQGFMDMNSVS